MVSSKQAAASRGAPRESIVAVADARGAIVQKPRLWYVNVFVTDLGRAIHFYGSTLGLQLRHGNLFYLDQLREG